MHAAKKLRYVVLYVVSSQHASVVTANVVPSLPIFHTDDGGDTFLRNFVLTRATRRNIPEDGILHGPPAMKTLNLT
jgi:hypothetical protein